MLTRRTDLAVEAEALAKTGRETPSPEGVRVREESREGCPVTRVEILDGRGEAALGKPVGTYVTVDLTGLVRREEEAFPRSCRALAGELSHLLQRCRVPEKAPVLVVGLGNRAITPDNIGPDAVGPGAADHTLVTRHLIDQAPEHFGDFRPVAALAAGVLGTTGVESGELAQAVAGKVQPGCVIAVDALAARSLDRICATVQLSDTGIVPGSGVGNHRFALNEKTLGVPVIAVGVPTVVDGATLALDILEEVGRDDLDPAALRGVGGSLMVTPRDIDQRVKDMAKVIGFGIDLALHPRLSVEDVELFLS